MKLAISLRFLQNVVSYLVDIHSELLDLASDTFNMDRSERIRNIAVMLYSVIKVFRDVLNNLQKYVIAN